MRGYLSFHCVDSYTDSIKAALGKPAGALADQVVMFLQLKKKVLF